MEAFRTKIIKYALRRWAKVNNAYKPIYTPIESKDIGGYTIHAFEFIDTETYSGAVGIIDHAFFAGLPQDDEVKFGKALLKILDRRYDVNYVFFYEIYLMITATIDQLLESYWEAYHEG